MKKAISLVIALLIGGLSQAQAAHVESAVLDSDTKEVRMQIRTMNYCNSPRFALLYVGSGRSAFGPHRFKVQETPIGRKACQGEGSVRVVLPMPEEMASFNAGQTVLLLSEAEPVARTVPAVIECLPLTSSRAKDGVAIRSVVLNVSPKNPEFADSRMTIAEDSGESELAGSMRLTHDTFQGSDVWIYTQATAHPKFGTPAIAVDPIDFSSSIPFYGAATLNDRNGQPTNSVVVECKVRQ